MEQQEQSNTPSATPETRKEGYLNELIEEAKPLRVVGNKDDGYCVVFGAYRISDFKQTPADAVAELYDNQYMCIINLIGAILTHEKKNPL